MKIELNFGNKKDIISDVVTYKTRKSLVSGLYYVDVKTNKTETTYSNVFSVRVL